MEQGHLIMFSYRIHGMNIMSPCALKQEQDFFAKAQITLRLIQQKPILSEPHETHILFSRDKKKQALLSKYPNGDLSIDYFECGFFLLRNSELSILQIHSDTDFFEAILTTQILPLLSSLFRVTLHGGVFVQNGKAAIYLGEEGSGKSTLTAYLQQQGYHIFSDDVAALDFDTKLKVYPGLPEIRINEDSYQKLITENQMALLPKRLSKHQILISQKVPSVASISAFFLLAPHKKVLKPLRTLVSPAKCFQSLIEHQFRWDIWNAKILKNEFQILSSLCETIPCYRLEYPMDYEKLPWIAQQLERSLHGSPSESPCLR